jgi:hypothetical protein
MNAVRYVDKIVPARKTLEPLVAVVGELIGAFEIGHLVSYTPSSFFSRPLASSIINSSSPPMCSSLMNI